MHDKTSFDPISNDDTLILVLGTIPGDKSIALGEYYGHARNRFWKVIATITNNDVPLTYPEKKELLLKCKIAVWDVARKANRKSSLDSAIKNEKPNDLDRFIERHKNLKLIVFNGKKSQVLFNKYFGRKDGINYCYLPSTSPANAASNLETLCKLWGEALKGAG